MSPLLKLINEVHPEGFINQLSSDFGNRFEITLAPVASDLTAGTGLSGFSDIVNLHNV
jgi:hypothetical protein